MSRTAYIYALHDPTDASPTVYIGRTVQPRVRLQQHHLPQRGGNDIYIRWIRAMLARGVSPEMVILETVPPGGDWEEAERFWIESVRATGLPMANISPGGKSPGGGKRTEAARQGMSQARVGERRIPSIEEIADLCRSAPPKHSGGRRTRGVTGYRGVTPLRRRIGTRYLAQIPIHGVRRPVYLGVFDTPEEAARVYDVAARAAWGPAADLNFPVDDGGAHV